MKGKKIVLGAVFLAGFGLSTAMILPPAQAESTLVQVNGEKVTNKDLDMALSGLNEGQREMFLNDPNNRHKILENVINRELLAQKAMAMKLDQTQEFKDFMDTYRKQILMNLVIQKEILPQLTSSAIKRYYELNRDKFSTSRVHVQHILLSTPGEAMKILNMARRPGVDFQELAEKYSKDPSARNNRGELGFIGHGVVDPDFADAAFSANPGEIVGPIHTVYGYHVIKVIEKKAGHSLGFGEVEMQAKAGLERVLLSNYLTKLRDNSTIQK